MFRWLRHERVVDQLRKELDDERATIVTVACAIEPECRERITRMQQELDLLRSQVEAPPSGS